MTDELALVWLNLLAEELDRRPNREDPEIHLRWNAVRHAMKVIQWRTRLRKMFQLEEEP